MSEPFKLYNLADDQETIIEWVRLIYAPTSSSMERLLALSNLELWLRRTGEKMRKV